MFAKYHKNALLIDHIAENEQSGYILKWNKHERWKIRNASRMIRATRVYTHAPYWNSVYDFPRSY